MTENITVKPGNEIRIGLRVHRIHNGRSYFGKQVNEQRVLTKYGKELSPFYSSQKIRDIDNSGEDHTIQAHGINDKRTGPEFFVDWESEVPEISDHDKSKAQQ